MLISTVEFQNNPLTPVDAGTRQLDIFGTKSDDAIIEVYANDELLESVLDQNIEDPFYKDIGTVLYSFKFSFSISGYVKIRIKVLQGEIFIKKARAKYPAKIINNKQEITYGHFYLWQPMTDSKFLIKFNGGYLNNDNGDDTIYRLKIFDFMEYYHLFFRGTPYWVLTLNSDKSVIEVDSNDLDLINFDHSDRDELEIIKQELIKRCPEL